MHNVETMFYAGETPWHKLGTKVAHALTSDEALVAAGLDWQVQREPIFTREGNQVSDWVLNRRNRDGQVLGVVGEKYQIVQNDEAFQWVDELVGEAVRFETAGALAQGKRVWMTARLLEEHTILGDPAVVYLTFTNGHDGRHAVQVVASPVRVVCQNTLNLATATALRSWSVNHSRNVHTRLSEAQRTLQLTHRYLEELDDLAVTMSRTPVAQSDWVTVCKDLIPPTKHELPATTARRDLLMAAWYRPDQAEWMGTAWGALNAVSWVTSHAVPSRNPEQAMTRFLDGDPLIKRTLKYFDALPDTEDEEEG